MIAVRKTLTVPAAGVDLYVQVAGRSVYVEQSPIDTPEGVPTFRLDRGGDGIPMYSQSAFTWLPSFDGFWIRGTAAAAGEDLFVLVYEDPCAEGVLDANAPFDFNTCPEPEEFLEPTGTPTHALRAASSSMAVYDSTGALVRTLVGTGTYRQCAGVYVDYGARYIYWAAEDDVSTNVAIYRINFDGTGLVTILDTGHGSSTQPWTIDFDPSIGRLIIGGVGRVWTMHLDGSDLTVIDTTASTPIGLAGLRNGLHYLYAHSSGTAIKDFATASFVHVNGIAHSHSVVDVLTESIYSLDNTTSPKAIHRLNYEGTIQETIESEDHAGSPWLYKYGRWVYFEAPAGKMCRFHLDDTSIVETALMSIPGGMIAPWWE